MIIGRTDTVKTHDINEGIRRANLYVDAGADMAMLFPNTVERNSVPLKKFDLLLISQCRAWRSTTAEPLRAELERTGYKVLYHPSGTILIACKAIKDAFTELKEKGHITMDPKTLAGFRRDSYGLMVCPITTALNKS